MLILTVDTHGDTLRCKIQGSTCENVSRQRIQLNYDRHDTVLEYLAAGWELIGPPVYIPKVKPDDQQFCTWWLKKEESP